MILMLTRDFQLRARNIVRKSFVAPIFGRKKYFWSGRNRSHEAASSRNRTLVKKYRYEGYNRAPIYDLSH